MKKMKNIIKIFAVTALATFAVSCNDEFLERYPLNSISDVNYWKTVDDLRLYANIFYNRDALVPFETSWGTLGPYGKDADYGTDTQVRSYAFEW